MITRFQLPGSGFQVRGVQVTGSGFGVPWFRVPWFRGPWFSGGFTVRVRSAGFGDSSVNAPVLLDRESLLLTLLVKLAVMAVLATMLASYRRFRHILIFERRGWLDRLVFTLVARPAAHRRRHLPVPLELLRRRPHARGRVPRRAHRRPVHRRAGRSLLVAGCPARLRTSPASGSRSRSPWGADSPAAACARPVRKKPSGSSRRSSSSICHKHVWQMLRKLEPNWQVMLLLAPVALETLRQALGTRFGDAPPVLSASEAPW